MLCNVLVLTTLLGAQLPGQPSTACPIDCFVHFGNGLCALRVEDCSTHLTTVMISGCIAQPCSCGDDDHCSCPALRYTTPVLQPAYPGHDGPKMQSNLDLTSPPALTVATVGDVEGEGDYEVTSVGTAAVAGTSGGATEYYAMFKVTHPVFSTRYLGMRVSDATSGTPVVSKMNLHPNKDGEVVERALLFSYTESGASHTYWFHVVGPASGGNPNPGPGPGPGPGPDPTPGAKSAPAPAPEAEAGDDSPQAPGEQSAGAGV